MRKIGNTPCKHKKPPARVSPGCRAWLLCSVLCLLLTTSLSAAQEYSKEEVGNLYHWAYSTAFGTGTYRIGDERIYVLRLSPKFQLANIAPERVNLNLKLPFTVGFQDLDSDIDDLTNSLKIFSFVPGLELECTVSDRWLLKPFAHLGWGREMDGQESAWITFSGLNSRYTFYKKDDLHMDLLNGIQWFRFDTNDNHTDRFSRLVNGLEFRYPLNSLSFREKPVYLYPHILHFWYFQNLGFSQISEPTVEINEEIEFGLAIGSADPIDLGIFQFDRFGIGYRIGDDTEAVRFYLTSEFD